MENKFTQKAQNVLALALSHAQEGGSAYIGSEHLLLGLVAEKECVASKLLARRGVTYHKIKSNLESYMTNSEKTSLSSANLTPRVKKIIENSSKLSEKNNQALIGSEHLLYSLLCESDCLGTKLLEKNSVLVHELQSDVLAFIHSQQPRSTRSESKRKDEKNSAIDMYARNLNELARSDKIDPTVCRDKETERIIQILSRRTKNNPCLIGEAGVGKTAVVEGLATRIVHGNIPQNLENKVIYSLDIPSLIAGAKYRGEFEDRMKSVMLECLNNPNIILFIDEIHTIIGAGSAEGAIDAANILKPTLARGEIQIIGATTIAEYRKYIERDSALERRFQPVRINEPTEKETEAILRGLRPKYESYHKIRISDEAILASVELSKRYITDRYLPDKAIDLMDEAASRAQIVLSTRQSEDINAEKELDLLLLQKEKALDRSDFNELKLLKKRENAIENRQTVMLELQPTVALGYEDVARVVTDWTGIPVNRLLESESEKLLSLENELKKSIVGQDDAISAVSQAIRRSRTGLKQSQQPMGSFLLVGPSGVGKTELCVSLSKILFDSKDALIRFDMSEYMEKHSVSKLIGAPAGYVGYGEGGLLTEKVRRNPYCIVLFDEIEKAHPEIFNLLLQILEDGTLTDSQGRRVSFKDALIMMTSNLSSSFSQNTQSLGFSPQNDEKSQKKEQNKRTKAALERTFKPEFLSRIDEIVIFNTLSESDMKNICKLMLSILSERIKKLGISLDFEDSALNLIVKNATDEDSGARRIRREIRRLIENPISNKILFGEIAKGDLVSIFAKEDQLSFTIIK